MIAELGELLTLEEPIRTPDAGGGAVIAWSPVDTVWAAIRPRSGSETAIGDRRVARVTHEIWLRARAPVTPAMRFVLGDRLFAIEAVLQAGARRQWLKCLCREELL
ncbi:MAG: phage head closure protein [Parvularculaceae bacterium]|nr:phage head closure protein [Parvularculaceae bacterium]